MKHPQILWHLIMPWKLQVLYQRLYYGHIQNTFYKSKVKTEDKIKGVFITYCKSNLHITLDKTVHSVESARWKHGKVKGLPDVLLWTSDPEGWWTVLPLRSQFYSWKRKKNYHPYAQLFFCLFSESVRWSVNLITLIFPWSKGVNKMAFPAPFQNYSVLL